MKAMKFTHKIQKAKNHAWTYLKLQKEHKSKTGKKLQTFTDEGQAFRTYYEGDAVEL